MPGESPAMGEMQLEELEAAMLSSPSQERFALHAFKFVNAKGEVHYVKFHW